MKRLLPLTALRAFEAMVRCGSIKCAAEDLHVTVGAVSQQLRRLEEEVRGPLFERRGRGLVPTREAQEFAADLGRAFRIIGNAADRFRSNQQSNPLKVAALQSIATRWIVPALSDFRAHAPTVRVRFTYIQKAASCSFSNADVLLSVVDGPYRGSGSAKPILEGAVQPVCSPAYLKRLAPDLSPAGIALADLLHDRDTGGWVSWFQKAGMELAAPLPGDTYEDFGLLASAALAGHGIALCPMKLIAAELASGDLIAISEIATLTERAYVVVLPDDPRPDALNFADWVVSLRCRTTGGSGGPIRLDARLPRQRDASGHQKLDVGVDR